MSEFADRPWPAEVRELAVAVLAPVRAAQRRDRGEFDEAVAATAAFDQQQVALVLGSVLQLLLEETHPDGFGADDLQTLLEGCARHARVWTDEPDLDLLVFVIAGAVGVQDPEETPPGATPSAITAHGALLVTELLLITRRDPTGYLVLAIGDVARDQTMELP